MPKITCVFASIVNARSMISLISVVSSSQYESTSISASERESITVFPNISTSPFPKNTTAFLNPLDCRYFPTFPSVPLPIFKIVGIAI